MIYFLYKHPTPYPIYAPFLHTQKLIEAYADQNADAFGDAIREYDSISRLDQWYTTLLLRVKKSIDGESDLR